MAREKPSETKREPIAFVPADASPSELDGFAETIADVVTERVMDGLADGVIAEINARRKRDGLPPLPRR